MTLVIEIDGLCKSFTPPHYFHNGLKELLLHPIQMMRQARTAEFTALHDVTLEVEKGEIHGVIGRNGAGKSTLLAVLSRVLRPTSGSVAVRGRISPLLELGVGFVWELSADENVILNGILLGMRRHEMEERLDEIIDFAELQEFRHQPLKTFSSGMQSRLGFSIAVHANPDVLLVDEVLAVGDAHFQDRCLARIASLRAEGATILFVSHDLRIVSRICNRVTWLEKGRVVETGPAAEVTGRYEEAMRTSSESSLAHLEPLATALPGTP